MSAPAAGTLRGDIDLAGVGAALAQPARVRMLLALGDGRALPASTLACEASVAPSTASVHLGRLLDAGFLAVTQQGRHRYYRLAGPHVIEAIEALSRFASAAPVRSLREGTRAHALRYARMCYDHLAGRLGVAVMQALLRQQLIAGGDGLHHPDHAIGDRLSSYGRDISYQVTPAGWQRLDELGIELPVALSPGAGLAVRYCVDWSEQAHHLSGAVGAALTAWMLDQGWFERQPQNRALRLTPLGIRELDAQLGVTAPPI